MHRGGSGPLWEINLKHRVHLIPKPRVHLIQTMAAAAAAVRAAKKRTEEQDEGPKPQNHGVYVLLSQMKS